MRHLQVYENFENDSFFKPKMYQIHFSEKENGFDISQVYFLALRLFKLFNEHNLDFRIYEYDFNDRIGIAFLFNHDISNEFNEEELEGLNVKKINKLVDDLEDMRIYNEYFEAYINSKKYNL